MPAKNNLMSWVSKDSFEVQIGSLKMLNNFEIFNTDSGPPKQAWAGPCYLHENDTVPFSHVDSSFSQLHFSHVRMALTLKTYTQGKE